MVDIKDMAVLLPLLASVSTVVGQIYYKKSANIKQAEGDAERGWFAYFVLGNALFAGSVVLNFFAMKFMHLFVVYAFTALNYVFVTVSSGLFLQEKLKWNNIVSSILIASGVFLISAF